MIFFSLSSFRFSISQSKKQLLLFSTEIYCLFLHFLKKIQNNTLEPNDELSVRSYWKELANKWDKKKRGDYEILHLHLFFYRYKPLQIFFSLPLLLILLFSTFCVHNFFFALLQIHFERLKLFLELNHGVGRSAPVVSVVPSRKHLKSKLFHKPFSRLFATAFELSNMWLYGSKCVRIESPSCPAFRAPSEARRFREGPA